MDHLRRFKFPVALFAVAGLLANLIVAALCCVPSRTNSALADFPVDLLGSPVLCSDHGTNAASSDGAPNPGPPAKPCPICMTSVAVALLIVALTFVLALVPARSGRFAIYGFIETLADQLRRSGLGSRAPPLHA